MGVFGKVGQILHRNSEDSSSLRGATPSDDMTTSSRDSSLSTPPRSNKKTKKKVSLSSMAPGQKMVHKYMRQMDHKGHDLLKLWAMHDPSCTTEFVEAEMPTKEYIEELGRLFKSIPDLTFSKYRVEPTGDPNTWVARGLVVSGTHTGEPYGFGPFPPIEASGVKFVLDPEDVYLTVNEAGKICHSKIVPRGDFTGPHGIYTKIGGFPLM